MLLSFIAYINGVCASPIVLCESIDMEVHQSNAGVSGHSIEINLKGKRLDHYSINLIMPKGKRILDAKRLVFNNLESGKYIVVVTSRDENDNHCPTYVNVSIE